MLVFKQPNILFFSKLVFSPLQLTLKFSSYNCIKLKKHFLLLITICFLLLQSSCVQSERNIPSENNLCPIGKTLPSNDGVHRVALVIGVGQYKSSHIPDLPGPPEDAKRIYKLLTGPQGYGFPKQNVCVLLDEHATTENFKNKFNQVLINRVKANDQVLIYYAGHGSQTKDLNGDEQDGMDETFVFHDARTDSVKDFIDDDFDVLIKKLYKKTKLLTIFLDSCNSGTAMRGDVEFLSRFVSPAEEVVERLSDSTSKPEQLENKQAGWLTNSLKGMVVFTAAGDGTSALEKNSRGVFTDAILTTLGQSNDKQLTYAQIARQIRPLVKSESYQIPYFQGDLSRFVFSGTKRDRPLSWEIVEVSPQLKLSGFPLPGIGKGTEFRVYSGAVKGSETKDPAKAKGFIVLDSSTGINAIGHISLRIENAEPIQVGDVAVLSRPSNDQRLLKVTLRAESKSNGISVEQTKKLISVIEQHIDAKTMIALVEDKGDFELSYENNSYVIKGPENLNRNSIASEDDVIENLRQHALQRVLISLRGEGGQLFTDQETLQVQIVPAKTQNQCAEGVNWQQQSPNSIKVQDIPLCYKWNVKVKLKQEATKRLLIGGLILSTDGNIFGFPADGSAVPLGPGEEVVFAADDETFFGSPPLNIEDQIIVFGTQENNPVPWSKLTLSSQSRAGDDKKGLYRILDRYISGTRGVGINKPIVTKNKDIAWTLSSISMRVVEYKK